METQNMNGQNFLVIFAFMMLFLGLFLGRTIWYINPEERVAQIVSCEGYEDDFLKTVGFENHDDCVNLNLALHKQYIDDCLKNIKTSNRESFDMKQLDLCVYYSFERQSLFLSSEYFVFRNEKIKQ